MANRRPQAGGSGGRRMDYRNDRSKNFGGRSGVSPWQGGGPGAGLPNLLPLSGGSTEATLALASNIINLLQPRQNPVPSLLDMPIRRDFVPNMGRFDRNYGPNRMGNQGNFRRTGNYNRAGERINTNRKQFKPNDGPRQQNKSSPKKDADSKAKPVKESDADEKNKDGGDIDKREDGKKDPPKTRYDEINPQLLKCHICNKSMWDGRSFENHLSGRAHAIMMQKTAESYALTADTMRQEFKIREMKRTRKSGVQQPSRDFYCAMCDMYATDGAVHRTSVGHRKLKKYLHPTCTACHKEMPTRIELDEHRLCADHLRNMQDKQDVVTKPKPEVMVISTLTMEQSYLRDDRQRKRRDHDKTATETDNKDGEENQDQEIKKEAQDAETTEESKPEKSSIDNDKTIIDYKEGDDLSHVTSDMIPVYSTERGVGASFLSEFRCVQCRLCRKLLDGAGTAAVHLRTWKHHQLFVRSLQPQQNQDGKKRGGDEDKIKLENNAEEEQNDADGETEEPGSKRRIGDNDDGQWKRRKTTNNDEEQDDIEQNGHEEVGVKEELNKTADNVPDGDLEMPPAEELEDWEQSVDEILNDEKESNDVPEEPVKEAPEPEPVKEAPAPEPVKEAPPPPAARPRGSPRARARGRGRARGRY